VIAAYRKIVEKYLWHFSEAQKSGRSTDERLGRVALIEETGCLLGVWDFAPLARAIWVFHSGVIGVVL
jgi:hypothetical protein